MESSNKPDCCSSNKCNEVKDIDDPEMISMVATAAILIAGFLMVAFVSGPVGLIVTLAMLSALGLYYAIKGDKSC